jgi:hypothetical protein
MYVPGFNPKALSDDELFAKAAELQRKMNYAYRFSSMGGGAEQIQTMITMLENERAERIFNEQWNMMERFRSDVIETDPDLKAAATAAKEKNKPQETKQKRPRVEVRRSFQPTAHPVVSRSDRPTHGGDEHE